MLTIQKLSELQQTVADKIVAIDPALQTRLQPATLDANYQLEQVGNFRARQYLFVHQAINYVFHILIKTDNGAQSEFYEPETIIARSNVALPKLIASLQALGLTPATLAKFKLPESSAQAIAPHPKLHGPDLDYLLRNLHDDSNFIQVLAKVFPAINKIPKSLQFLIGWIIPKVEQRKEIQQLFLRDCKENPVDLTVTSTIRLTQQQEVQYTLDREQAPAPVEYVASTTAYEWDRSLTIQAPKHAVGNIPIIDEEFFDLLHQVQDIIQNYSKDSAFVKALATAINANYKLWIALGVQRKLVTRELNKEYQQCLKAEEQFSKNIEEQKTQLQIKQQRLAGLKQLQLQPDSPEAKERDALPQEIATIRQHIQGMQETVQAKRQALDEAKHEYEKFAGFDTKAFIEHMLKDSEDQQISSFSGISEALKDFTEEVEAHFLTKLQKRYYQQHQLSEHHSWLHLNAVLFSSISTVLTNKVVSWYYVNDEAEIRRTLVALQTIRDLNNPHIEALEAEAKGLPDQNFYELTLESAGTVTKQKIVKVNRADLPEDKRQIAKAGAAPDDNEDQEEAEGDEDSDKVSSSGSDSTGDITVVQFPGQISGQVAPAVPAIVKMVPIEEVKAGEKISATDKTFTTFSLAEHTIQKQFKLHLPINVAKLIKQIYQKHITDLKDKQQEIVSLQAKLQAKLKLIDLHKTLHAEYNAFADSVISVDEFKVNTSLSAKEQFAAISTVFQAAKAHHAKAITKSKELAAAMATDQSPSPVKEQCVEVYQEIITKYESQIERLSKQIQVLQVDYERLRLEVSRGNAEQLRRIQDELIERVQTSSTAEQKATEALAVLEPELRTKKASLDDARSKKEQAESSYVELKSSFPRDVAKLEIIIDILRSLTDFEAVINGLKTNFGLREFLNLTVPKVINLFFWDGVDYSKHEMYLIRLGSGRTPSKTESPLAIERDILVDLVYFINKQNFGAAPLISDNEIIKFRSLFSSTVDEGLRQSYINQFISLLTTRLSNALEINLRRETIDYVAVATRQISLIKTSAASQTVITELDPVVADLTQQQTQLLEQQQTQRELYAKSQQELQAVTKQRYIAESANKKLVELRKLQENYASLEAEAKQLAHQIELITDAKMMDAKQQVIYERNLAFYHQIAKPRLALFTARFEEIQTENMLTTYNEYAIHLPEVTFDADEQKEFGSELTFIRQDIAQNQSAITQLYTRCRDQLAAKQLEIATEEQKLEHKLREEIKQNHGKELLGERLQLLTDITTTFSRYFELRLSKYRFKDMFFKGDITQRLDYYFRLLAALQQFVKTLNENDKQALTDLIDNEGMKFAPRRGQKDYQLTMRAALAVAKVKINEFAAKSPTPAIDPEQIQAGIDQIRTAGPTAAAAA